MNILLDMNLSPKWTEVLSKHGHHAVHWAEIGSPKATDYEIMAWARINGYIVFTHDLDFGTLLTATNAAGPSVFQLRTQDIGPDHKADLVLRAFNSLLKKSLLNRVFKNSKCKEQKKFKVAAYLDIRKSLNFL